MARNILIAGAGYECVNTLVTKISARVCEWTLMSAWRRKHPPYRPGEVSGFRYTLLEYQSETCICATASVFQGCAKMSFRRG